MAAVNSKLSTVIGLFFLLSASALLILCLLSGQQSPTLLSNVSFLDVINISENPTVRSQAKKLRFGTWGVCVEKSSPLTSYCRSSENLAANFQNFNLNPSFQFNNLDSIDYDELISSLPFTNNSIAFVVLLASSIFCGLSILFCLVALVTKKVWFFGSGMASVLSVLGLIASTTSSALIYIMYNKVSEAIVSNINALNTFLPPDAIASTGGYLVTTSFGIGMILVGAAAGANLLAACFLIRASCISQGRRKFLDDDLKSTRDSNVFRSNDSYDSSGALIKNNASPPQGFTTYEAELSYDNLHKYQPQMSQNQVYGLPYQTVPSATVVYQQQPEVPTYFEPEMYSSQQGQYINYNDQYEKNDNYEDATTIKSENFFENNMRNTQLTENSNYAESVGSSSYIQKQMNKPTWAPKKSLVNENNKLSPVNSEDSSRWSVYTEEVGAGARSTRMYSLYEQTPAVRKLGDDSRY